MADEGRSGRRARKQVNYSQFAGDDDDFDDDFKDMTPPPSKKLKVAKEPKLKLKKDKKEPKPKKERKSVDEKVYERELELAMAMSKSEADEPPSIISENKDESTDVENNEPDNDMPVLEPIKKMSPRKRSPKKKPSEAPAPDLIEVLEEDVEDEVPGGRKRRQAAAKAVKKFVDSDEEEEEAGEKDQPEEDGDAEFKADAGEASDSGPGEESAEEEEDGPGDNDGDSDFEGHWNKTTKKKGRGRGKARGGRASTPSAPKVKPRLSATVQPVNKGRGKPLSKTPSARSDHHSSSPSAHRASPGASLVIRKPNWIPPGASGDSARSPLGGVNIKSPGGIRLGLSKKSRVKPLHSSVKVPT